MSDNIRQSDKGHNAKFTYFPDVFLISGFTYDSMTLGQLGAVFAGLPTSHTRLEQHQSVGSLYGMGLKITCPGRMI